MMLSLFASTVAGARYTMFRSPSREETWHLLAWTKLTHLAEKSCPGTEFRKPFELSCLDIPKFIGIEGDNDRITGGD